MRMLRASVVFITSAIMVGCKAPVYDADVQFTERLVIEGILTPGNQIKGIYIGKTLPVKTVFDPTEAEVHDAVATVVVDGIGYSLQHVGNGLYQNLNLVATAGKTYSLNVEWNGLRVTAQTLVPFPPDTLSLVFSQVNLTYQFSNAANFVLDGSFKGFSGETYGAVWSHDVIGSDYIAALDTAFPYVEYVDHSYTSPVLVRDRDIQSDGNIHVPVSGNINEDYFPHHPWSDTLVVTISAFDEQFFDYYNSKGSTTTFEDLVLGMSPGAVKWNVSGEGIGMFIGKVSITRNAYFQWH